MLYFVTNCFAFLTSYGKIETLWETWLRVDLQNCALTSEKPGLPLWKPVILNDCSLDCYSKLHSWAFKILLTAFIWSILHLQEAVQLDGAIFGGLLEKTLPHVAKHMVRLPS